MTQVLYVGGTKKLHIDHSFVDGGEPAVYGQTGGLRILLTPGAPARPKVNMTKAGSRWDFFYEDGTPVTTREDVEWIPEKMAVESRIINPRALALAFVEAQAAAPASAGKKGGVKLLGTKGGSHAKKPEKKTVALDGGVVLGTAKAPERLSARDRVEEPSRAE